MNDERVLEERLRTQLSRWAELAFPTAEIAKDATDVPRAVAPVPMSEPLVEQGSRAATKRVLVAASVVVALAAGAVGLVNARHSDAPATSAEKATLVRLEWRFVSFVVGGKRFSVPSDVDATLRFDGSGHFSGTACNDFYGAVTISSDRLKFGGEQQQTLMRCNREIQRRIESAVGRLRRAEPTWSVRNDTLRLTTPGVVAELARPASMFPTRDLVVRASSERDGTPGQWQFGYRPSDETFLVWEGRGQPGQPFGNVGVRVQPNEIWATAVSVGSGHVVLGYLPDATASAKYVADSKRDTALTLYTLPGGNIVFAQAVDVGRGEVVAYDASGHVVGRSRVLPG